jgi:ABC-type lipoprotein release transport system permease subunit
VVGIVAGLALAIMVAPVLSQLFSEADPRDPLVYALVSGMLAVTGLAAGLIPSVRAARVHPMTALRYE